MNINDFKPFQPSWEEVIEKQAKLELLFEPGLAKRIKNFDINCFEDQELFKTYCWRITEELCEAIEAIREHDDEHTKEELIDALNFTLNLYRLCGVKPKFIATGSELVQPKATLEEYIFEVIYKVNLAANCLKNRSWRSSQYMVDLYVFEPRLLSIFECIMQIFRALGLNDLMVRELWSLKYKVNKFRVETKY